MARVQRRSFTGVGMLDIHEDDELLKLLSDADAVDVADLIDYLTDFGEGRVALSGAVNTRLKKVKEKRDFTQDDLRMIIHELQLFGGNTISNAFRGKGVMYREILHDAAESLGVLPDSNDGAKDIELRILKEVLGSEWPSMSIEDRRVKTKDAHSLTGQIRNMAKQTLVGGMAGAAATGSLFSGVVGRAATLGLGSAFSAGVLGLTSTYGLSSQAYRVTVPCVVQIAYIRCKFSAACY